MSLLSLPIVLGIQQKPTWHRCLYRHRCMEVFSAIPWIWLSIEFLLGRAVEVVTWAAPVSCGKLGSPQDPVVLCLYPMSSAASSSSDSMLGLKQRQQQWWHDMTVVSFLVFVSSSTTISGWWYCFFVYFPAPDALVLETWRQFVAWVILLSSGSGILDNLMV